MARLRFYQKTPIRFKCTGCGACCLGSADENMIELAKGEVELISQHLDMSPGTFTEKFLVELDNLEQGIRINQQGRCVFLQKNNRCAIYQVRPRQCQTYPYWPEIMATQSGWDNESYRCEGINTGDVVLIEQIEQQLKRFD